MFVSLMAGGLAALSAAAPPQPIPAVARAQSDIELRLARAMGPAVGCVVAPAVHARDHVTVLLVPRPGRDRVGAADRRAAAKIAARAAHGVPVRIGQTSRRFRADTRSAIARTLAGRKRDGQVPEGITWVGPEYVVTTPHCPRVVIAMTARDVPRAATDWAEAQRHRYGADRISIRHYPPGSTFPA
jgi:hypothetical protein